MAALPKPIQRFFRPPDPALLEAGAGGARLVAWTRLWFWLLIGLAPGIGIVSSSGEMPREVAISTAGVLVMVVYSIVVLVWLLKRKRRPPSLEGYITSTVDITLITLTMGAVALADRHELIANSQSLWAVYLLVIITSCLRFNTCICLYMGLLTIVQYLLLMWVVVETGDVEMSRFDLLIQSTKVMLMVASTGLAMGIVNRGQTVVQASGFDVLTGLATRRYFDQRFGDEIARARRDDQTLSLALFDLDHFKKLNDRYGHEAGDIVLARVSRLMNRNKRSEDFLARWGGEELAMILPGANAETALKVANRMAAALRTTDIATGAGAVRVSVSGGVAELDRDGADEETLFAAADARVYEAKEAGRDRIVI
ncbi:MAG: GGDEF domain-containing protein [Pseudomonadota bacterium]